MHEAMADSFSFHSAVFLFDEIVRIDTILRLCRAQRQEMQSAIYSGLAAFRDDGV